MAAGLVETDEGVYVAALAAARLGALSVAVEGRRRRRIRYYYYYHYYFIPKSWSLERRSWRRGADCIQCVMCVCVCVPNRFESSSSAWRSSGQCQLQRREQQCVQSLADEAGSVENLSWVNAYDDTEKRGHLGGIDYRQP